MDPSLLGFNGRRHGLHGRSLGDGLAGIGLWLGLSFGLHFGHGPDHLGCNLLLLLWDILQDAPWARPGGTGLLHGNLHGWHDCTQGLDLQLGSLDAWSSALQTLEMAKIIGQALECHIRLHT